MSQVQFLGSPVRSPRRALSEGEADSTGVMGPAAAVDARRARKMAARRAGSEVTVSLRDRVAEPTLVGTDPLAKAPMNTGRPRERGADAYSKACRKQREDLLRAMVEKVGILD